jgi:hypothetical protein
MVSGELNDLVRLPRDIPATWRQAVTAGENASSIEERGHAIGLQCRCALIRTSIISMADAFPPELFAALVQQKFWSAEQALAWIKQITKARCRSDALIKLAPILPDNLWEQMLDIIQRMSGGLPETSQDIEAFESPQSPTTLDEQSAYLERRELDAARITTLAGVLSYLPEWRRVQILPNLLKALLAPVYYGTRTAPLNALIPFLSEGQLREAIANAKRMPTWHYRTYRNPQAETFVSLLPHLAALGFVDEAISVAQTIARGWKDAAEVIIRIARVLPSSNRYPLLTQAREVAQEINNDWGKFEVLTTVAVELAEIGLLSEAEATVELIEHGGYQQCAWARLIQYLPEERANEKLMTIRIEKMGPTVSERKELCRYLVPQFAKRGQIQSVFGCLEMVAFDDLVPLLRELTPHLAELGYGEQLIDWGKNPEYWWRKFDVLSVLAWHLPPPLREIALREALANKQPLWDEDDQAWTLTRLTLQLPQDEQEQKKQFAITIINMIRHFMKARTAEGIEFDTLLYELGKTFSSLASYFPEALQQQVIEEVIANSRSIEYIEGQIWVLSELLPYMTESVKQQALHEMRVLIQSIEAPDFRAEMEEVEADLLGSERTPSHPQDDNSALVQDGKKSPSPDQTLALEVALADARKIKASGTRGYALIDLLPAWLSSPPAKQYAQWTESIYDLATHRSRRDLLKDLQALIPIITVLGGTHGLTEVAKAIIDVGIWFY